MAKEFELYNRKYAKLAGTALKTIVKRGGSIAREDFDAIKGWDESVFGKIDEDHTIGRIRLAVYTSNDAEQWQQFRVSLKGLSTREKLYCLMNYWLMHVSDGAGAHVSKEAWENHKIRVWNYLGALKRGGQLNSQLMIVRD